MNKFIPRRRRGAALVELAIILPLLLALLFGIAEIGRSLVQEHVLIRHVEAAARYLARSYQGLNSDCSSGANWPAASASALNLAVYGSESGGASPLIPGMTTGEVSIGVLSRPIPGYSSACVVQVKASVPYPAIFGATIPILGIARPVLQAASEERYVGE